MEIHGGNSVTVLRTGRMSILCVRVDDVGRHSSCGRRPSKLGHHGSQHSGHGDPDIGGHKPPKFNAYAGSQSHGFTPGLGGRRGTRFSVHGRTTVRPRRFGRQPRCATRKSSWCADEHTTPVTPRTLSLHRIVRCATRRTVRTRASAEFSGRFGARLGKSNTQKRQVCCAFVTYINVGVVI